MARSTASVVTHHAPLRRGLGDNRIGMWDIENIAPHMPTASRDARQSSVLSELGHRFLRRPQDRTPASKTGSAVPAGDRPGRR